MTGRFWERINRSSMSATAVAGLLVQVGRPVVSLVTLPLLLAYLGQEGLGVWMIALSVMGLVGFISAGISASVITAISRTSAKSSATSVPEITSAATLIAALWGALVLALLVPCARLADWEAILHLRDTAQAKEVQELMIALTVLLAFGIVTAVPRQIMIGRMHGYLAHLLDFSGVIAGAAGLIIALSRDAPLWVLGVAFTAPSLLLMMLGGLAYLRHAGITLFSPRNLNRETLRRLGRDSLRMAGYQGAFAISSQSDLLLIGVILGAPASAAYGVAQRVFSLPVLVGSTINYAQWPAIAGLDASGSYDKVAKIFRRTLWIGSGLAFVVSIFAAFFYTPLLELWLGHAIATDPMILSGMVVWVVVATLVNTCDIVLRARNETTFLMRAMIVMAALNVTVTILLLPRIGASGAIWGSVTGFTFALLLPYFWHLREEIWRNPR